MTEPRALVLRRLEVIPVMANLDVVAWVLVLLTAVKFWRLDEPVTRRFERVVSPAVAVRVPVKFAAEDMV